MTNRRSLLSKYFLICSAVILISFICLGAVLLLISSHYFTSERTELIEKSISNIAASLKGDMLDAPDNWKFKADRIIKEYSINTDSDILLISGEGNVLIKSELSVENEKIGELQYKKDFLEQYKQDPTCVYSDFGGIFSNNITTVGINFSANGPVYYILAIPSSDASGNYTGDIMRIFIISAVIVMVISLFLIFLTSMRMVDPIKEMSEAAKKIGHGDFDVQLPEYSEREFNDLASAFNEMAASLKSYDTMRNSFIANVSHELRTPMTSIGGFVDGMLDNTIPPEEQKHYLKIISSEVHRLTRLVRSMLNLAKIEAGELKPNFTSFSVLDPIVDTLVTFEKRLEEKNIEIRGLDTDRRFQLWADSDLIHQVIYNLLENAIKFVDKGGYISFHFEEVGYLTVIYIRNSGEGLTQEELSLVFDRFYKTDKSRGIDASGVGLGLNIVRSIIKLHGGKIQVRSVVGEYTEFMFSLPNKDIT